MNLQKQVEMIHSMVGNAFDETKRLEMEAQKNKITIRTREVTNALVDVLQELRLLEEEIDNLSPQKSHN